MRLSEWRLYKAQCLLLGVKPKSNVRQLILFRLCDYYDAELVLKHWGLISKILDR